MTVNELIERLEKVRDEGKGELPVLVAGMQYGSWGMFDAQGVQVLGAYPGHGVAIVE